MSPITEVTFADVLIADLLTSYARVFGDANATMCVAISGADPLNYARKLEECSRSYAVPLVMWCVLTCQLVIHDYSIDA
jgi:hypothetical protein